MKAQKEAEEKLKAQQLRYELLKQQYSDIQDSDDNDKYVTNGNTYNISGIISSIGVVGASGIIGNSNVGASNIAGPGICSNSITGTDQNLITRSCANIGLYVSNTTGDSISGYCGMIGTGGSQYGGNSTRRSSSVVDHREIEDRLLDDEDEIEATRQLIQRRRRLFSHHRQYELWRKKQFSYDSYHYRPIVQSSSGPAARRRRLYRRQFSCVERSEGSRDSHDSRYYIPSIDGNKRNSVYSYSFEGSDNGTVLQSPSKTKLQHFHYLREEEPSITIAERCTRSRINSAIFVSSEGRGFDSIEFLRRHGSQSVLCRKARSAENISDENRTNEDPSSSCQINENDDNEKNFSNKRQWYTEDGATTRTKNQSVQEESIELAECHPIPVITQKPQLHQQKYENLTTATTTTSITTCNVIPITTIQPPTIIIPGTQHSAAVTTANAIVGSISIETPPPHLRQQQQQQQDFENSKLIKSIEIDSTETSILIPPPKENIILTKQRRKLTHQKSTSSTPNTSYSRSPSGSPSHSPILINLKNHNNTPKINTQLPTLSISEPSPPHDTQEFL